MEIKKLIYICFALVVIQISCKSDTGKNEPEPAISDKEIVVLSSEQITQSGIQLSGIEKRLISETVNCSGMIEADPNQKALVSPTMKAYLKSIKVHVGDYVKRGQTLAFLTHPDYIKLQQEYFETLSQYEYYKQDFKRQGELSLENAASLKTMQQAQNEFRKTEAQLFSLKKQLAFLGINADSIHIDRIHTTIALSAPIEGYVTIIDGEIGMLCPEEVPIFHLVGSKNLILEIKVFEKDAPKIKVGQKINYSVLSGSDKKYTAHIKSVAWALDESNTISAHAHIKNQSYGLLPGMFVKATIQTNADSVLAVPEEALVKNNTNEYIFAETDEGFRPVRVISGMRSEGWVEITSDEPLPENLKIVSKGAYYINSEWIEE